nr:hypothetical protein CFP56_03070 [Quercus suber]
MKPYGQFCPDLSPNQEPVTEALLPMNRFTIPATAKIIIARLTSPSEMATNPGFSSSTGHIPSPPTSSAASETASVNGQVPQLFRANAIEKGRAKLLILSGETEVDQTTFTGGMAELEENGYELSSASVGVDEPFPHDLEPVFRVLDLSTEVPQYFAEHKSAGTYQGISFDETGANFWNRVNVHEGIVITENNHSPRWMVSGNTNGPISSPLRMPPLRRFSDVLGLQFLIETQDEEVEPGTDEVDLNHWFSHDVRNGDTVDVMNSILELERKDTPGPWPGLVYHPDRGEGELRGECTSSVPFMTTAKIPIRAGSSTICISKSRQEQQTLLQIDPKLAHCRHVCSACYQVVAWDVFSLFPKAARRIAWGHGMGLMRVKVIIAASQSINHIRMF